MPCLTFDSFQHVLEEESREFVKNPKKKQFIGEIEVLACNTSIEELHNSVGKLVKNCENDKVQLLFRKYLSPVVDALDELSGTIDGASTTNFPVDEPSIDQVLSQYQPHLLRPMRLLSLLLGEV